jgi:hypothetical protein
VQEETEQAEPGSEQAERIEKADQRESALAERERHDKEKSDAVKARQIRLGHVPDPNAVEEEETTESDAAEETSESEPKATARKKST